MADIFIDYWNSSNQTWTHGSKIMEAVDIDAQMSVSVFGRLVYVFLEGRDPALFFLEDSYPDSSEDTWVEVVIGMTASGPFPGPGARPPSDIVGINDNPSMYDWNAPANEAPMECRAWIRNSTDSIRTFGLDVDSSDEPWPSTSSDWTDTSGYNLYTPGQILQLESLGQSLLLTGGYDIMAFLYDTRTGRKSQPSVIMGVTKTTGYWGSPFPDSAFMYLEGIYDATLYDQLWVYRSVKAEEGLGVSGVNQLWLDGIAECADIETLINDRPADAPPAPYRHIFYPLRLNDLQLSLQLPYLSLTLFDEGMPKGGASLIYENTALVSKISGKSTTGYGTPDEAHQGLGEIRWSDTTELSPELFPPGNRYVPAVPSNEVLTFERVGDNILGFARDRLYHIRKESQYLNIEEMHEGYGTTGHRATTAVGSVAMFLNHRGLKQVGANGKLDDVRAIDDLVITKWKATSDEASLAFDPVAGAVFVYNPEFEQSACFWVNTGIVSEIHDLPFHSCRQGVWPTNVKTYHDTLVRRAIWLQNAPNNPTLSDAHAFKARLYIMDIWREKKIAGSSITAANGHPRLRLLDVQEDGYTEVWNQPYDGTGVIRVQGLDLDDHGLQGAKVYTTQAGYEGVGARIVNVVVGAGEVYGIPYSEIDLHPDDVPLLGGHPTHGQLEEGAMLLFSPVIVKVVGAPIRMEAQGQGFADAYEYVSVRQMEMIGVSLADTTGPPLTSQLTAAQWEGMLYEDNGPDPVVVTAPKTRSDGETFSMEEGESIRYAAFGRHGRLGTSLSPGVRIIVPDADYRLLGINLTGTIRASVKSKYAP